MPSTEATHIDSTLTESRKFPPPAEFSARAWVKSLDEYHALCKRADADPETFWAECARNLDWFQPFAKTLEWNFPHAKWFVGGTINAAYNCLDRHLDGPRRNKAALIWEGEPGDSRVLTYQMLADEVARCANALKSIGVKAGGGDRDAGVRANRCDSLGGLRRLLVRSAGRTDQRRGSEGLYHRGRRMAPRANRRAEEQCR
jgi:acetyl-CoA synthetase